MKPYAEGRGWVLYHGDCREVLPSVGKVDAVVTDLPYGLGFSYADFDDTRENLQALIESAFPIIRSVAPRVYVSCGITQIILYPPADWILAVTWNTTGSRGKYGYAQWMPILAYGTDIRGCGSVNGVLKSDIISINGGGGVGFMRKHDDEHPCPKPMSIMRLLVKRLTLEHELVCDPMMGAGSTGVAAVLLGRRFVGVDVTERYCEVAAKRLRQAEEDTAMFAQVETPRAEEPELFAGGEP